MASPNQPSPALLRDSQGNSIVPLTPLPGIDFGAHLSARRKSVADESQPRTPDGYFPPDVQHSETEADHADTLKAGAEDVETTPQRQSRKDDHEEDVLRKIDKNASQRDNDAEPRLVTLQRTQTAPAHTRSRTPAASKQAGFLSNLKSRNGESQPYKFDPIFTDSDESSESDADDHLEHQRRKRDEKKHRSYSRFHIGNDHFRSRGHVSKRDGRLNISINETANTGYIAKALGQTLRHHLDLPNPRHPRRQRRYAADHPNAIAEEDGDVDALQDEDTRGLNVSAPRPKLNIVILVIGSRGDIQPFIRIGQILVREHGHRVRVATHATFRDFVHESGLDFFSVGGDPSELMAFMVKNPGLIPSLSTLREGEVQRRRAQMGEMFEGMWRACTNIRDGETDPENLRVMTEDHPFIADAIIANPPSMAAPHIVERLGIPLFMAFTFPYSPTQAFPHPLANIRPGRSNVDAGYVNFMSYPIVEMMTWQGLGDVVNRFRVNQLHLEPVSALWAPGALYRMKVPYTYMWSPFLIPKPSDWGPEIDITGFVFLDLASDFKPPKELTDFLEAGEPPIYIGFGSIVVDDPEKFTKMIFEAVRLAGVRALVNKGWGGLGGSEDDVPDNIFMLGNTPHDWLFPRVRAVVHHGGAGTTAIGLKCGRPTMIVPFFGDQPFWGAEVAKHKAGAKECVPYKKLTAERLAQGIKDCLTEEAAENAKRLAEHINAEGDGAANAVRSFHRSLPLAGARNMRCSMLEERVAVWKLKGSEMRLSALAAEILLQKGKIKRHDLRLLRHCSWNDFDGPGEPITGTVGALTDSISGIGAGVGMVPVRIAKHVRRRQEHEQKRQKIMRKKEEHRQKKAASKGAPANALNRDANGDQHPTSTTSAGGAGSADARPSVQREATVSTINSTLSSGPDEPLVKELAGDIGFGLKKSGVALLTMPETIYLALAQGFHNAPRLWGDATVRKPTRITGIKSGLVAARRELVYGVYDGFTGVVTQPIGGWKDGNTVTGKLGGFGSGVAKGLGGLVVKNVTAVVAPPAFVGKGVLVFLGKKAEGESSKKFIKRSQYTQGLIDLMELRQKATKAEEEHPAPAGNDSERESPANELKRTYDRVTDGWRIYEDVWRIAREQYGPAAGNVVAHWRFNKERSRWAKSGALENAAALEKAMHVRRHEGEEGLKKHFEKKEKVMRIARQPREPGMEQKTDENEAPTDAPGGGSTLPNGRTVGVAEDRDDDKVDADKADEDDTDPRGLAEIEEEESSDSTVVASPSDESAGHDPLGKDTQKVKPSNTQSGKQPRRSFGSGLIKLRSKDRKSFGADGAEPSRKREKAIRSPPPSSPSTPRAAARSIDRPRPAVRRLITA